MPILPMTILVSLLHSGAQMPPALPDLGIPATRATTSTKSTQAVASSSADTSISAPLQAGAIHCKFQDGQLRYLYVGDKEIIRRIYFAVRDKDWNTVAPQISNVTIKASNNGKEKGFDIDFDALCKNDRADFAWHGHFRGTADGKIAFATRGKANTAFDSQRIGICVLYGADSLAGQSFETADYKAAVTSGKFPPLITPTLVGHHFQSLRYTLADKMEVRTNLIGAPFDMEDQRNYGDSSYKAYAPMEYTYPAIPAEVPKEETFTVQVRNPTGTDWSGGVTNVLLGERTYGAKMPQIVAPDTNQHPDIFMSISSTGEKNKNAPQITWSFSPAIHLPDDDTFMENVTASRFQVQSARALSPKGILRLDPVSFNPLGVNPPHDPRYDSQFAAAWSLALLTQLTAENGANQVAFAPGGAAQRSLLTTLTEYAGADTRQVSVTGEGRLPVTGLAVAGKKGWVLWLANTTDQPQKPYVGGLPKNTALQTRTLYESPGFSPDMPRTTTAEGALPLTLPPYAVIEIRQH